MDCRSDLFLIALTYAHARLFARPGQRRQQHGSPVYGLRSGGQAGCDLAIGITAEDLAKYFTTSSGDIVFDFKIKGDMAKPKFMLGPISKQAVTAMAVDKVSQVIHPVVQQASDVTQSGEVAAGGKKTDVQKAAEYIGKISEFMSQNR